MIGLRDIAAMKLNAIVQNGSRVKDFVDLYVLLNHLSFNQMYAAYENKYPGANRAIVQNAVLYHKDVKPSKVDFVGEDPSFERIADRLWQSISRPNHCFS